MLTFSFTGADGRMTESEMLTSGMVGKQVQLLFDASWNGLNKTVVFHAGDLNRVVTDAGGVVTVPARVLERPFCHLRVGVYGTDAAGTLVIPTIMAEGPMIQYGADPMEDETAKELPVWQDLQNQIGFLPTLQTQTRTDLVWAINELLTRLIRLEENCVGLDPVSAQLLVDILSRGSYTDDQSGQIEALALALGVEVPVTGPVPVAHWNFLSGSWTDAVSGLEAEHSAGATLDTAGAHTASATDYITVPLGQDGATLDGHYIEIKFGSMSLVDTGSSMRLAMAGAGVQPVTTGMMWTVKDCWTSKITVTTEFTDLQMFSGKSLIGRPDAENTGIDWYFEDRYICSVTPVNPPTHVSLGCSTNGAYPLTVEYIKIFPAQ